MPLPPVTSARLPATRLAEVISKSTRNLQVSAGALNVPDLYAPVDPAVPSGPTLNSLLRDAVERGVDVRVALHSTSPNLQTTRFSLSSSGIDLKIFPDALAPAEVIVGDDASLFAAGDASTPLDPQAVAAAFAARFDEPVAPTSTLAPDSLRLWTLPEDGVSPFVHAIDQAEHSVHMAMYELDDPAVVSALERAALRGVEVRALVEPKVFSADAAGARAGLDHLQQRLTAAGAQVKANLPAQFPNAFHAKFFIVDGNRLLVGTGNLSRSYVGGNPESPGNESRDFWLEDTRTAPLGDAQQLFDADWSNQSTVGMSFPNLVVTPDNARSDLLELIASAKTRLYIYNQGLSYNPIDADFVQHIIDAKTAQPGLDVRVISPPPQVGPLQPGFTDLAALHQKIRDAGISLDYLVANYPHAKAILADDRVYIGSQNFSVPALSQDQRLNREVGEIVSDPEVQKKLLQTFLADQASAQASAGTGA